MSLEPLQQEAASPSLDTGSDSSNDDLDPVSEQIEAADYFDASSMAPLTPASLVSLTTNTTPQRWTK